MLHHNTVRTILLTSILALAGCPGSTGTNNDAGDVVTQNEAGNGDSSTGTDSGAGNDGSVAQDGRAGNDAAPGVDSGNTDTDSGSTDVDAGPGDTDSGATDADSGSSDSDAGQGDDACAPATTDPSSISASCDPSPGSGAGNCPAGYDCAAHTGIVTNYACEIPCEQDCDCPATTTCMTISDKSGSHLYCRGG